MRILGQSNGFHGIEIKKQLEQAAGFQYNALENQQQRKVV
jgi:hypothetical protein